jgi:Alpha/beta hydrolase of unknown function (DUF900)
MAKVFLIHGSMVGVPSFYKSSKALKQQLEDGMYSIFRQELKDNNPDFYLFKWMSKHNPKEKLNPKADLDTYYKEQQLVLTTDLQIRLYEELMLENPTVIVSHSMGCELLINMINNLVLPESVKTIITINSDSPEDKEINSKNVTDRLINKDLEFINLHSITDLTLAASALLNKNKMRAGQNGYKNELITNQIVDIYGNHNLASTLESTKKLILSKIK